MRMSAIKAHPMLKTATKLWYALQILTFIQYDIDFLKVVHTHKAQVCHQTKAQMNEWR